MICVQGDPPLPPRRSRRALALVATARRLFLARGYDAVSVGDIVAAAGGSLATLYDLFGNKRGLLEAVLRAEQFEGLSRIGTLLAASGPPAAVLEHATLEMLRDLLDPELIALIRLLIAEGLRHPSFAAELQLAFVGPLVQALTARFEHWSSTGALVIAQPQAAAEMYVGLFCYAPQLRALFASPGDIDAAQIEAGIRFAVAAFVRGVSAA